MAFDSLAMFSYFFVGSIFLGLAVVLTHFSRQNSELDRKVKVKEETSPTSNIVKQMENSVDLTIGFLRPTFFGIRDPNFDGIVASFFYIISFWLFFFGFSMGARIAELDGDPLLLAGANGILNLGVTFLAATPWISFGFVSFIVLWLFMKGGFKLPALLGGVFNKHIK